MPFAELPPVKLTEPLKRHPARNLNPLTIDPAILVRKKRRDHGSNIVRHAGTPQRSHFRYTLINFGIVAYHAVAEVGLNCAWCNHICGDPARAEFFSQIAGQHFDRTFRGSVGGTAGQRKTRESRRDIYDPAAIVHQGKELLRQEENTFHVNIENPVELSFCCLLKTGMQRIARIVHKIVEPVPSPTLQRLVNYDNKSIKGANVTGVETKSCRFPPHTFGLADETLGFLLIRAIGEEDIDATLRKIDGSVAAQAAAPTRDDRDLVCHTSNSFGCHNRGFS